MKTVYLDSIIFECHNKQKTDTTRISYETNFFNGKCNAFIKDYHYIPVGKNWVRSNAALSLLVK